MEPQKPFGSAKNLIKLQDGKTHEVPATSEGAFIKIINLVPNLLGPKLRLLDVGIGRQGVLNAFRFTKAALSGSGKNKQMYQFSVDNGNIEGMSSRIKLKYMAERKHG